MLRVVCACSAVAFSCAAFAEVTVKDAWVRGTVAGQSTTGAFMTITSASDAKLVGVQCGFAKSAELHTTMVSGGVNHMHAAETIALPAGKPVALKPGGHHVMLIGVEKPITAGKVPLTLIVEDANRRRTQVEVTAEVRPLGQ
jgi:periplasmic copper chaperone A